MDKVTEGAIKISYARVLVEISCDICFPEEVPIVEKGTIVGSQSIQYEWFPDICSQCRCFGHVVTQCSLSNSKMDKSHSIDKPNIQEMDKINSVDIMDTQTEISGEKVNNNKDSVPDLNMPTVTNSTTQSPQGANSRSSILYEDNTMEVEKPIEMSCPISSSARPSPLSNNNKSAIHPDENPMIHSATCPIVQPVEFPLQNVESLEVQTSNTMSNSTHCHIPVYLSQAHQETHVIPLNTNIQKPKSDKRTNLKKLPEELMERNVDVVDNPEWLKLINNLKSKTKRRKKISTKGTCSSPLTTRSSPHLA